MIKKYCDILFVRSWWVIAFLLSCSLLYEQGLKKRELHYQLLYEQLRLLQLEKIEALHKQRHLQLQVNSQSDLSWMELTLMKGLGLSPEDQQKVYFSSEESRK